MAELEYKRLLKSTSTLDHHTETRYPTAKSWR